MPGTSPNKKQELYASHSLWLVWPIVHGVYFRKYYVPYGLTPCSIRPTKRGIALRIDEWAQLLNQVVPADNTAFPDL